MSYSWERTRRRYELMHAALDEVGQTGRPAIPALLLAEIETEFGDLGGFLSAVQYRWYNAFDALLDPLLEEPPADLSTAVAELWLLVADAEWTSRLLLDEYAEHLALAAGDNHHRHRLLAATGVDQDDVAAACMLPTAARRGGVR